MLWLTIIILSYFLLAVSSIGDEYLLNGYPNPKNYSFYTGVLGILILLIIPFVGFAFPDPQLILLGILTGIIFAIANFFYFTSLERFDLSRVAPAIGGFLPIFTFVTSFFLFGSERSLTTAELIAFSLLVFGSVFINLKPGKGLSFKSLLFSVMAAFLFSMSFIFSKYLYSQMPFWSGLIIMRVGGFLLAIWFIFTKEVKDDLFHKKPTFQKKTGGVFLGNQIIGASAYILQSWAVALVPFAFLPFINALEGIKYAFIIIFVPLLAKFIPQLSQEKNTRKGIIQKAIAVIVICIGLFLVATK